MLSNVIKIPARFLRDFGRHIRNFNYEWDDANNLLVAKAEFHNYTETFAPDGLGWQRNPNLVTTEGKNHFLDVVLHGASAVPTWYVAPFSGNVTVLATWDHSNFTSNATELSTEYSEATRQEYSEIAASAGATNNNASPATITANTTNVSVWGFGMLSVSTKLATSGVLLFATKYSAVRSLPAVSDQLNVKWTVSL